MMLFPSKTAENCQKTHCSNDLTLWPPVTLACWKIHPFTDDFPIKKHITFNGKIWENRLSMVDSPASHVWLLEGNWTETYDFIPSSSLDRTLTTLMLPRADETRHRAQQDLDGSRPPLFELPSKKIEVAKIPLKIVRNYEKLLKESLRLFISVVTMMGSYVENPKMDDPHLTGR